jgi:hypothetical protein
MTLNDSSFDAEQIVKPCTKKRRTIITLAVFFVLVVLVVVLPLVLKNKTDDAPDDAPDDADIDFAKRYTFIQSAVAPYSQPSSFVQQDSPQSQALQWLVYQDKTTRNINMDDTSSSVVDKIAQRYALMVFYYACGSVAWNSIITPFEDQVDVSECDFTRHADQQQHPKEEEDRVLEQEEEQEAPGMLVHNEDEATIACNDEGEIVHLNLRMQNLAGRVPDEIGALIKLTTLDLGHNLLEGPIPRVIVEKLVNLGMYM